MADGKRLRNQTAERGAVDVCFLEAEPFDQRRCIVAHVFERVGLDGIACVAGIALIVSDDRQALFKMVGFRAMHQHNWWSRTASCVGNGCAVGLQPMHGASSLDCGGVCRHLPMAHSRYGQSPELCKVILACGTPKRPIAPPLTFVSRTCGLSGCTF